MITKYLQCSFNYDILYLWLILEYLTHITLKCMMDYVISYKLKI